MATIRTKSFCSLILLFYACTARPTYDDLCDDSCRCSKDFMDCSGANLLVIPKVPPSIKFIDLSGNRLRSITSLPSVAVLRHLNLSHNQLSHIEPTSFQRLNNLETLDLSFNSLTTLHPGLLSGLYSLKNVNLSHNTLQSEDVWLQATSFRKLDIDILDLSFNRLTKLSRDLIGFFSNVKTLRLGGNKFDFLDPTPLSEFMESLKRTKYEFSFFIDGNEGELKFEDFFFKGLQMKALNLRGSHVTDLKFMEEVVALNLDLSDNPLYIKTLKVNRHLGRTCEELYLSNIGLQTKDISFLSSFTNLKVLDLSRNNLYLMDGQATINMPFLHTLDLSQNSDLSELSLDFGQSLSTLERLNLSGCAFERIDPLITSELGSLSVLDLSHNNFQTLPDVYANIFETVRSINMSSNPLHCNCEMMWFVNWTKTAKFVRSNVVINDFYCASPVQRYIKDMTLTDFKCREPNIFNITRNMTYPEGTNDVMFHCRAEADPPPTLTWTSPFGSKQSNTPSANRTRYTMFSYMKLSSLKKSEHEGWYECSAENQLGRSVGRTYLKVLRPDEIEVFVPTLEETTEFPHVSPTGSSFKDDGETKPSTSIEHIVENSTSVHRFPTTSQFLTSPKVETKFNFTDPVVPAISFKPFIETSTVSSTTSSTSKLATIPITTTTSPTTTTTTSTTTSTTQPPTTTKAKTTKFEPTKPKFIQPFTEARPVRTSAPETTRKAFQPLTTPEMTSEDPPVPRNISDESSKNLMSSFENRVAIFVAVGILCLLATLLIGVLAVVLVRKRHRRRKYLLDKKNAFLRSYSSNGSHSRRHRSNSGVMTTPLNSTLERPRNGFDILLAKEKGLS